MGTEWNPSTFEWPVLNRAAMPGTVGEFVDLASEHSEADPAAILVTLLARFAAEVGAGPYFMVGDSTHFARVAAVIVGASSKSRKGTSYSPIDRLFQFNESAGLDGYIPAKASPGPFSSGEGIIWAVRDEVEKFDPKKKKMEVIDPGVKDKRLFIMDEEFGGALAAMKREGNTLSAMIRRMWDKGNLDPLTKVAKIKATGAHISWVSHITLRELHMRLAETDAFNGFANRILWVCARRAQVIPIPVPMPGKDLATIQRYVAEMCKALRPAKEVKFSPEATEFWCSIYPSLTEDHSGLVGVAINRGEAQVLRLAMIYAFFDGMREIEAGHLTAALALWEYCRKSAKYIFNGFQADKVASQILDALKKGPMTGTELHRLFKNHERKNRLEISINELIASKKIEVKAEKTAGRSRATYKLL